MGEATGKCIGWHGLTEEDYQKKLKNMRKSLKLVFFEKLSFIKNVLISYKVSMIYIKRIFLGLAFYLSSQVFLLGQNADFTFGSSIGFGGALFDNTNYITLGFFDSNVFTALSDEVFLCIDPFGNYV